MSDTHVEEPEWLRLENARLKVEIEDSDAALDKYWKENNPDMQFSYVDRILKATHEKVAIANQVLAVKQLLKGDTVVYDQTIYSR